MSKNGKTKSAKKAEVMEAVELTPVSQPQVATEATTEVKKLGRPIVEGSARQKAIAEREAKLAAGELKRGRKAKPDSKRQQKLAERAEKLAAGLLTGKRGRPVDPNSPHQQKLSEKQARIDANGGVPLKPGRPKMTDEEKAAAKAKAEAAKQIPA